MTGHHKAQGCERSDDLVCLHLCSVVGLGADSPALPHMASAGLARRLRSLTAGTGIRVCTAHSAWRWRAALSWDFSWLCLQAHLCMFLFSPCDSVACWQFIFQGPEWVSQRDKENECDFPGIQTWKSLVSLAPYSQSCTQVQGERDREPTTWGEGCQLTREEKHVRWDILWRAFWKNTIGHSLSEDHSSPFLSHMQNTSESSSPKNTQAHALLMTTWSSPTASSRSSPGVEDIPWVQFLHIFFQSEELWPKEPSYLLSSPTAHPIFSGDLGTEQGLSTLLLSQGKHRRPWVGLRP